MSKKKKELPWVKLDGQQEPPPNTLLALYIPGKTNPDDWHWEKGFLQRIEFSDRGKEYVFRYGGEEIENATYFLLIEPPKE
jgi:hypothetical protein